MSDTQMSDSWREEHRPEVGDLLKAGELVLLTSGCYSDFVVNGLYRVKRDIVMPGRASTWGEPGEMEPDIEKLSVELEGVKYREVWRDN